MLIDATNPFGGEYLLPAGFLREPPVHLRRAQAFVVTRSNEIPEITPIIRRLGQINAETPIFTGKHVFDTLHVIGRKTALDVMTLRGKRLLALCGLGNPASFHALLSTQELNVAHQLDFPDHHWYTGQDVELMRRISVQERIDALITTEKDEVKLLSFFEKLDIPCYIAAIRLEVQPQQEFEKFLLNMLKNKENRPD